VRLTSINENRLILCYLDNGVDNVARLTINEETVKLGVSTRTLRRKIKQGNIHAAFEDGKYYLDTTEVDRLSSLSNQVDRTEGGKVSLLSKRVSTPTSVIPLDKTEYDSLMSRLGFLEGQRQLLLEHQADGEALEKELVEARAKLAELEAELAKAKRSW
jgi:predicted site-specific integrase-resolvase